MWLQNRLVLVDHKRPYLHKEGSEEKAADNNSVFAACLAEKVDPDLVSSATITRIFNEEDSKRIFEESKKGEYTARELAMNTEPEFTGRSFCSRKDTFCRKTGFLNSVNRALKGLGLALNLRFDANGHRKYDLVDRKTKEVKETTPHEKVQHVQV